ncbi:unnamed protein product [Sphagnum troendelagicum]|uniref:Uncharacterized protein n=1 Tax=Sphagnum troendelagicum TaxID=128251 RepID=A0ABP0U6K4_9BRYO
MEPNLMEKLHREFLCVPVCACSVFHEHPVEPVNHLERSDGHLRNASILVLEFQEWGCLEELHFLPCVGKDPLGHLPEGKVTVALEGLSIVQQHTPDC